MLQIVSVLFLKRLSYFSPTPAPYLQGLDQMTHGHPGGDGVGVDDDVRSDSFGREHYVFLAILDATGTLHMPMKYTKKNLPSGRVWRRTCRQSAVSWPISP